jgi:hypothetical protein
MCNTKGTEKAGLIIIAANQQYFIFLCMIIFYPFLSARRLFLLVTASLFSLGKSLTST